MRQRIDFSQIFDEAIRSLDIDIELPQDARNHPLLIAGSTVALGTRICR
jgi:hypothetical protein